MGAGLVARRYAKALYKTTGDDLAKAKSLTASLGVVTELFDEEHAGPILKSPVMPTDLKRSLLDYALDQGQAPTEIRAFCYAVVDAGRVDLLPQIVTVYQELLNEASGVLSAEVTSAQPMTEQSRKAVEDILADIFGKKILLETSENKELLGGFVVDVGNYKIDMSLKTKMDELAHEAAAAQ